MRCTRAVIYKENIENNIRVLKSLVKPGVKMCIAVKADGYGCGAVTTAKIAEALGVEYLAVATVDEGIELRENGINTQILLLSPCTKSEFKELVLNNITPLVFDKEIITEISETAVLCSKQQPVFLAIDTGMGRIGCYYNDAADLAKFIVSSPSLFLAGMITHFAVSDVNSDDARVFTSAQFNYFKYAIDSVKSSGINPGICSCANSAATCAFPEMSLDMVRAGISVYGYYPEEIDRKYLASIGREIELKPVMQFETEVAAIRRLKPGQSVSYGRTWTASRETDIAVLPCGYADGLLRRNAGRLDVAINGKLYPIRGRICMDQCMVEIGLNNSNVRRWDKAVFFGPKDKGAIHDVFEVANLTGTISYEIMTSISKRVPRVVI